MISAIFLSENKKDENYIDEDQLYDEIEMLTPSK